MQIFQRNPSLISERRDPNKIPVAEKLALVGIKWTEPTLEALRQALQDAMVVFSDHRIWADGDGFRDEESNRKF